MSQDQLENPPQEASNTAVTESGAYEVLLKRLQEQGSTLSQQVDTLNALRLEVFGCSSMEVLGRTRLRTENNCIARDIARVGQELVFGYNVSLGLNVETRIEDVFTLYRLSEGEQGYEARPLGLEGTWLDDPLFRKDFAELYTYYRDARLLELLVSENRLLASFQFGERITDVRVFRWSLSAAGQDVRYLDNRGERDITAVPPYDFEWVQAGRELIVNDRIPRISILDSVHIHLDSGDLVISIESPSASGLELCREALVEKSQSLPDLQVAFAKLGNLILLSVRPYKESQCRYMVCNLKAFNLTRIDAIGTACQQLPDDHGIVFPGGLYLQSGEHRTFESALHGMLFKRLLRSPNGEDFLYIFHDAVEGRSALFTYNTIRRQLLAPVYAHGHARLEDGRMVIFTADVEPSRNHPVQIWQTPFFTEEYAAQQPLNDSFIGRIGNAELVRGISDLYDLAREARATRATASRFLGLGSRVAVLFDKHHWLSHESIAPVSGSLRGIAHSGTSIADEFEKVEHVQAHSARLMQEARQRYVALSSQLRLENGEGIQGFVARLDSITELRGYLLTLREQRYIDIAAIDEMEQNLHAEFERAAGEAAGFMSQPDALLPYIKQLDELDLGVQASASVFELEQPLSGLAKLATGLELLSGLASSLNVEDATQRTYIVEAISNVYARMNQSMAHARSRNKVLASSESVAQFAAQFQLIGQGLTQALSLANSPQACDEQLSKLLIQLDELESRFGEHESFLSDVIARRDEVIDAFEQHRQTLIDARQRQAQGLHEAATRILDSLPRRLANCADIDRLNGFFASDPQILKLRELSGRLRGLEGSVQADDIEARLKAARDQAVRGQRDKADLVDASGTLLKLGPRHLFSINTQPLDLTLLPRDEQLWVHITGTDFFDRLNDEAIASFSACFQASLESESDSVYRSEYLAGQVLDSAAHAGTDLSHMTFVQLEQHIRQFSTALYKEGYEKGVHDHDAALILQQVMPCMTAAGLLYFSPAARALALIAWHLPGVFESRMKDWPRRARSSAAVLRLFNHPDGVNEMRHDIALTLEAFATETGLPVSPGIVSQSAAYLAAALMQETLAFEVSGHGWAILGALERRLDAQGCSDELTDAVHAMAGDLRAQWALIGHWVVGACRDSEQRTLAHFAPEAMALLLLRFAGKPTLRINTSSLDIRVNGLLGDHPTLSAGSMAFTLDDFFTRLRHHREVFVPQLQRYQTLRQSIIRREREALRIDDFRPRPLTSFVRNQLINDVYLPLIADNLAKQTGTAGEGKRSDLMGLLMLISPPGYGKTSLVEYVAFQLGMALVKINGPALGHRTHSLDPAQATDGPARQELEKLNLALEMGNNVCLLIDDIQHLSPEFLQKFISLCDGSRRIENVWKGQTRTCDLRGKKFCIVMAGNPYTESGELFKIPDMLVNRADVYNLGEVSGGSEAAFALSYIENCMTSNPVLAPLANRDMQDLYRLVEHARGEVFSATDLGHDYSRAQVNELAETLSRLMVIRDVLLRVNAAYIDSASQADKYRTEPPFRLQGSYRNMNKLAEKVSAVMNESEIDQLISDHYRGESQLLTHGAEENLLKLAELRGQLSDEQASRWEQIKKAFIRNQAMGGDSADVGNRIVAQLSDAVEGIRAIADRPQRA
ncbi:DNA repair ATPase [Pseudomonas syringae]|uniref:DNA repair ATPase n=1 Tax=Pseudomonas syringae CC1417 TaxID=1357272 RepID=A0AAU8LB45_PSESX